MGGGVDDAGEEVGFAVSPAPEVSVEGESGFVFPEASGEEVVAAFTLFF